MSLSVNHLYEFGDFRLNTKEKILMCDGRQIEITPKGFELLSALVENHGRLLGKNELMDRIWADSFVEESNLTFNIRQLRKILGDNAQNPTYIKTVRQHGYRFIAEVREIIEQRSPAVLIEEKPLKTAGEANLSAQSLEEEWQPPARVETKFLPQIFSRPYFLIAALFTLLLASFAIAFVWNSSGIFYENAVPILQADFKAEKLTNTGGVFQAVISPDGKRMAYSSRMGGKQGLWIRHLETSENIQIVPNSDEFYYGLAFSNDGETLYFAKGKGSREQIIYRVSIMGGVPKEIVGDTQGWFSLSPEDRQISFVRCPYQEKDYCSLYVADTDGKNERKLLTRQSPIRIGDNKFSPDGKTIAVALGQSRSGSQGFGLIEVDVKTGKERELTNQKFFDIKYIFWLANQSELLFTGYERFYRPSKIYKVTRQTGELQTLTNDSNSYNRISLDNSFQKMVATQVVPEFRLWVAPTENPDSAQPICSAQGGSVFTASGKIVYSSITDGTHNIWTINADGTDQRQLTSNQGSNSDPQVSSDERFIYFTSNRSGSNQVWRMNLDGSNQKQISEGEGGRVVFVSPDGNTVYYVTSIKSYLGKISIDNAGKSVSSIALKERMPISGFNVAGVIVAYSVRKAVENYEIVLRSVADGKVLKSFPLTEEKSQPIKISWANDGKSIFYLTYNNSKTIIWKLTPETGKSEKYTELSGEEEITNFNFSADGKKFAYIRGKWHHDAVLIKGLQ